MNTNKNTHLVVRVKAIQEMIDGLERTAAERDEAGRKQNQFAINMLTKLIWDCQEHNPGVDEDSRLAENAGEPQQRTTAMNQTSIDLSPEELVDFIDLAKHASLALTEQERGKPGQPEAERFEELLRKLGVDL